jgi:NAD-dependent dihydropyrimidine dehydrogenase PreA subunit
MVKIKVNYAKCIGENGKICVEICPVSVFRDENSVKPEVVNEGNCIVCRTCQFNCPGQAIEILA